MKQENEEVFHVFVDLVEVVYKERPDLLSTRIAKATAYTCDKLGMAHPKFITQALCLHRRVRSCTAVNKGQESSWLECVNCGQVLKDTAFASLMNANPAYFISEGDEDA